MTKPAPIPSLTGLRFFAAFFVLVGHMLPKVMPWPNAPGLYTRLTELTGQGMQLFFVLSGFVIHYNYSASITHQPLRGLYQFFVARIARLYPLYLVILAYQLLYLFSYQQLPAMTSTILPYYLLLVQTWFYYPIGEGGLTSVLGNLPEVSWSVSTECFFYLIYPLILISVSQVKTIRAKLLFVIIFSIFSFYLVLTAAHYATLLDHFGIQHFGVVDNQAYTFSSWLVYLSPYSRILEFILGCLCASIYMSVKDKIVSAKEEKIGFFVLVMTIISTFSFQWALHAPNGPLYFIVSLHRCFSFAPFWALIIFCCARYNNMISRALSSPRIVLCGEASYSLYLWHMLPILAFRWESAPIQSVIVGGIADFLRAAVTAASAIGLSLISWHCIEIPAKRFVRDLLLSPKKKSVDRQENPELAS